MIRKVLLGFATLLLSIIVVTLIAASLSEADRTISRTTSVKAPIAVAFAQVNNLENWNAWSPWKAMDPQMTVEYGPKRVGEGAWYTWNGDEVGTGKLTITRSVADELIETSVDFGAMGMGSGAWRFERQGDAVAVTWGFTSHGRHLMDKVFNLFLDLMLGPQLEAGLKALKDVAEA